MRIYLRIFVSHHPLDFPGWFAAEVPANMFAGKLLEMTGSHTLFHSQSN